MNRKTELDLMRLLHGELPEERRRQLEARRRQEPDLAAAYERLQSTWERLDLPPPTPVPPAFATQTARRIRTGSAALGHSPLSASRLVGAAAATAALAAGVLLGSWLAAPAQPADWDELLADSPTLAESYWAALEDWPAGDPNGEASP